MRHPLVTLLLLLVVCSCGLLVPSADAQDAIPETSTESLDRLDALIEQHQRHGSKDSSNAYDVLVEVVAAVRDVDAKVWREKDGQLKDGSEGPDFDSLYGTPDPAAKAGAGDLARQLLDEYEAAGVFKLSAKLCSAMRAVRPRYGTDASRRLLDVCGSFDNPPWDGRLLMMMLPDVGKIRSLVRIGLARFAVASGKGDHATAARAFEETLALARVASHQHTMIDHGVAAAATTLACGIASDTVGGGLTSPEFHDAISGAMDRQLPLASLTLAVEGERILTLDLLRWLTTEGAIDPVKLTEFMELDPKDAAEFRKLVRPLATPAQSQAWAKHLFDRLAEVAGTPRRGRAALNIDARAEIDSIPRGEVVLRMVAPPLDRRMAAADETLTRIAGLRAIIAIEQHRARHGAYPATLQALGEGVLGSVQDPFGAGALRYKLVDPEGVAGKAYLVYSVGSDGEDNGGMRAPNPFDALKDTAASKGFDFVLTRP